MVFSSKFVFAVIVGLFFQNSNLAYAGAKAKKSYPTRQETIEELKIIDFPNTIAELTSEYLIFNDFPENPKVSVLFESAYGSGHSAYSQYNLGQLFEKGDGDGVPANQVQASIYYTLASEQGHQEAQHSLGLMYIDGRGVRCDPHWAFDLLVSAYSSGTGVLEAGIPLSKLYRAGIGNPPDLEYGDRFEIEVNRKILRKRREIDEAVREVCQRERDKRDLWISRH